LLIRFLGCIMRDYLNWKIFNELAKVVLEVSDFQVQWRL